MRPQTDAHLEQKHSLVILGDSTIDNKVWLGKEWWKLIAGSFFGSKSKSVRFIELIYPNFMQPLSVVQHLHSKLCSEYELHDYSNDGFTTSDVLRGNHKDKVFLTYEDYIAHDFFPHEFFQPLSAAQEQIKKSKQVILSIGGNNFREFMQNVLRNRQRIPKGTIQTGVSEEYAGMISTLKEGYKQILNRIRGINPEVELILMTQYYPSSQQSIPVMGDIYQFLEYLREFIGDETTRDSMDMICKMMNDCYTDIISHAKEQGLKFKVVDITSSLNPNTDEHHVSQIEPSGTGGEKIASMLAYAVGDEYHDPVLYQFNEGFFKSQSDDDVIKNDISGEAHIIFKNPKNFPVSHRKKYKNLLVLGGLLAIIYLGICVGTHGAALVVLPIITKSILAACGTGATGISLAASTFSAGAIGSGLALYGIHRLIVDTCLSDAKPKSQTFAAQS